MFTRKIDDSFREKIAAKDIVPAADDENDVPAMNICDFLLDPNSVE